jgi:hypothetical protein
LDRKKVTEPVPYAPAGYVLADVEAIQALQRGEANEAQQKRALNWIINNACGAYDLEYREDARAHAFCSGRRFVGLQIVKLVNLQKSVFKKT